MSETKQSKMCNQCACGLEAVIAKLDRRRDNLGRMVTRQFYRCPNCLSYMSPAPKIIEEIEGGS